MALEIMLCDLGCKMPWVDAVQLVRQNLPTKKEIEQVFDYRRRRAKAKFYADENFPKVAVQLIREYGVHVLRAQEASLGGHPDENHAAFALKEKRVLLTCDRDYLDDRRFPPIHCPAIVVCDFGSGSIEEMQKTLRSIRCILSTPQFFDKWVKIDAKRESWTEHCRFLNGTTAKIRYRLDRGQLQEWVE